MEGYFEIRGFSNTLKGGNREYVRKSTANALMDTNIH